MPKSKIFQETFFNPTTKKKYRKHRVEIDASKNPFMELAVSLWNFQNTLEQEGGIPEELDARCINMMGMRFKGFIATLMDVYLRHQLIQNGSIDDFYHYLHQMEVGGESFSITEEEHEEISQRIETLLNNTDNFYPFLDSLGDFRV